MTVVALVLSPWAVAQEPKTLPAPKQVPDSGPLDGSGLLSMEGVRPQSRFYVDADYLHWWVKHGPSPVLLTSAPDNGRNVNGLTGGILGQPGTFNVFTARDLEFGAFSGLRAKAGFNFGDAGFWSLELGGFVLPQRAIDYLNVGGANGAPLLSIPFLDAATGQPSALDVNAQDGAGKPYLAGSVAIHSDLQMWGYEFNMIAHSIRTAERSVDVMFGFRSLGMDENLSIAQTITPATTGNISLQFPTAGQGAGFYQDVVANTSVKIVDRFGARNRFYGPQVGGRFSWMYRNFTLDLAAKVAVGVTLQEVNIDGATTAAMVINPNTQAVIANATTAGGVFALPSNIGGYRQNPFTVVPEVGLNLRYAVTSWLSLQAGYSALYWSNVARPGAQMDSTLNSKLVPTGALLPTRPPPVGAFLPGQEQGRPYFVFQDTAFWAHGINFGMELRY
jgi:hypothetical protein